eukprot:768453-Hanusia_phi.AAC.1
MGGYKGYGWAATVELLCTAFQSGPFGEELAGVDRKTGAKKPMPLGHVFLAIDIESMCDLSTFKKNAGNFLRTVRGSRKDPKVEGTLTSNMLSLHGRDLVASGLPVNQSTVLEPRRWRLEAFTSRLLCKRVRRASA